MASTSTDNDALSLAELDPERIAQRIEERDGKKKAPSALEVQKEARLAEKEKRLSSKKGPTPAPSEPPPLAPPPPVDRSALIDKITAYRERFPFLKKRNNVTVKSSVEEIFDELHYCELQLGSQPGGGNLSGSILHLSMMGVERFHDYWNPLGLNLNGLATVTQQNMDQFQPILDELMIKHSVGMYTSPEWRLALAIGATVMTVNAANQNPEMARAVKSMNQAVNAPAAGNNL
jgi:hypothetical protein